MSSHSRAPQPGLPSTVGFTQLSVLPPELTAACDEVLQAMAVEWEQGKHTRAEDWLARYPLLAAESRAAVQIVYEEVCLREEHGETVSSTEIYTRFPQWKDALRRLFDCHYLVHSDEGPTRFPEVGERIGELHLLRQLGQGAAGRVFLATQPSLSDRPLVVKITTRSGDEHLSLARLQHTHIAPLYSVQDFPGRRLRAICMPYLGGASWAWILQSLKDRSAGPRTGRRIVELLEQADRGKPVEWNRSGPAVHFLSRASYVQAVCWIGACLAEALQYAHARGLLHLDVKPSNVLLGGDGQPMLLDFHLAREVIPAHCTSLDSLGGTRGYMSPEQDQAAAALREGKTNPVAIDGRSDIYSLGILLYESLTGRLPPADEIESRRTLRDSGLEIGRGLEDVIHKCLAQRASGRYRDAAQLATDLRCSLADLPLQGVPNRSLRERYRKWRRRKPHALPLVAATLLVLAITGTFALTFRHERVTTARAALDQARQNMAAGDFTLAIEQLTSGRQAINWIPGQRDLVDALDSSLATAEQGRLAGLVHALTEQLRFLDGLDPPTAAQLKRLDEGCQKLWEAREKIVAGADSLSSDDRRELFADLSDLAIAWGSLRIRLADPAQTAARKRDGLRLLDEAQAICGPSLAIELARREFSPEAAAGQELPQARTAREHFALGRHLYRVNEPAAAADEFERALRLEPQQFWANFYLTMCKFRQEDYQGALVAASNCVTLSPQSAPCFYNRALCYEKTGQPQRAFADLTDAIRIDPTLAVAYLRRAALAIDTGDLATATADLHHAQELGASPAEVQTQRSRLENARGK